MLDDRQLWASSLYREGVLQVIKDNPGVNVTGVAAKLPEGLKKFLELNPHISNAKEWKRPSASSRDTARKHVYELLAAEKIMKVDQGYCACESSGTGERKTSSTEFGDAVSKLLSDSLASKTNKTFLDWFSPLDPKAASSRILSDPMQSHERFADFFALQNGRFTDSLFWLNDFLRDAIARGHLSEKAFSKRRNGKAHINTDLLEKGWKSYFGDTKLFTLTFAFSPPEVLEFLKSHVGRNLATIYLQKNWSEISEDVEKDRKDRERLTRERLKAQQRAHEQPENIKEGQYV